MSVRSFLDSNILVYTDDRTAKKKQAAALDLFEHHRAQSTGVLSTQVLNEYFVAATGKLGVKADLARRKVELFSHLDVVTPSVDDLLAAIDLHRLHKISYWDALIVRAAQQSGCKRLLSEDLQDGRRIGEVEIRNPFSSL